jgi:hypothetical protein
VKSISENTFKLMQLLQSTSQKNFSLLATLFATVSTPEKKENKGWFKSKDTNQNQQTT